MIHTALVVDDSRTARFMLAKILQRLGVVTATANSAEEALEYLSGHVPDAIFIDHVMPGIDGLHATQQIKADPRFVSVPIVIFTAKEGDEYIARAKAHGAHSVLTKPPTDEYVQGLLDVLGREVELATQPLEAQPEPGTATPPEVAEEAVERIARQAVVDAFGDRLEARLGELVDARVEMLRNEMRVQHDVETGRLEDLSDQAREAFSRDDETRERGARAEALSEAAMGRVDALQATVDRAGQAVAEEGEQLEALGQQLAELGQRVDDLAGLGGRVDEIQTQNADLAERTNKLVETYVERSSKRYAKAVATYVQKDAVRLADEMAEKHVLALRDELVRAQVEAGHKSVPLVPTVLATVALIAALGALLLAFF